MSYFLFAFLAVCFFCGCCHQFVKELLRPLPAMNQTGFSKRALMLKKQYQVFSWGVMTAVFLGGLVVSFYDVYTRF